MGNNIFASPREQGNVELKCIQYPQFYEEINSDLEDIGTHKFMQFRLVYEGQLPSGNGKSSVLCKDKIRQVLHLQLKTLWNEHPALEFLRHDVFSPSENRFQSTGNSPQISEIHDLMRSWNTDNKELIYRDFLAYKFNRCGYGFVPLVHKGLDLVCSLDILFLRRSNPGELIKNGGDLDNRIKTLFDALKVPEKGSKVSPLTNEGDKQYFCLAEDDSLITKVTVTTDKLLTPIKDDAHKNDVLLIISVQVSATRMWLSNLQVSG